MYFSMPSLNCKLRLRQYIYCFSVISTLIDNKAKHIGLFLCHLSTLTYGTENAYVCFSGISQVELMTRKIYLYISLSSPNLKLWHIKYICICLCHLNCNFWRRKIHMYISMSSLKFNLRQWEIRMYVYLPSLNFNLWQGNIHMYISLSSLNFNL